MREKDDRANADRFRWTPHVARKAAVAHSVERLHTPLGDSESARDKWVVHQFVNDTCSPQMTLSLCTQKKGEPKQSPVGTRWPAGCNWRLFRLAFLLRAQRQRHLRRAGIIYELMYDPFVSGRFTVAERSMQAFDTVRNRSFPCDMWRPTEPVGVCPIIL